MHPSPAETLVATGESTFASFGSPSHMIKDQLLRNYWIEEGTTGRGHQLMSQEMRVD